MFWDAVRKTPATRALTGDEVPRVSDGANSPTDELARVALDAVRGGARLADIAAALDIPQRGLGTLIVLFLRGELAAGRIHDAEHALLLAVLTIATRNR